MVPSILVDYLHELSTGEIIDMWMASPTGIPQRLHQIMTLKHVQTTNRRSEKSDKPAET